MYVYVLYVQVQARLQILKISTLKNPNIHTQVSNQHEEKTLITLSESELNEKGT